MATRSASSDVSEARRARAVCAIAAALVLALGIWRGAAIFTAPIETSPPASQQQQELLSLIEPLAGAGKARVSIRRTGKTTHNYLVFIDTARSSGASLGKDIESLLVSAVGFNAAIGDTLEVREFAFASSAAARPDRAELAELGVLGLLTFLLAWGAFAPAALTPATRSRAQPKRPAQDPSNRPRPVGVDFRAQSGSSTADAARTATEDPVGTAKIIRAWMRSPEDTA